MAEPRLEHFLTILKNKDFSFGELAEQDDDLKEFLYFGATERAELVAEKIAEQIDKDRNIILQNLALMHPLSQHIVAWVLKKIKNADTPITEGFDINEAILKGIRKNFEILFKKAKNLTQERIEYQEAIKKLKEEADQYKEATEEVKKLRAERKKWQAKVDKLKEDASATNIKHSIEELKKEEARLKSEEQSDKKEEENLRISINEIKKELEDNKKIANNDEELELLRKLLKKFPIDVEE